jgi:hypothetical protein
MPKTTPNAVMATMSSMLDAAIMSVQMPLSVPYPRVCSDRRLGTTTAGETAASTNLITKESTSQ